MQTVTNKKCSQAFQVASIQYHIAEDPKVPYIETTDILNLGEPVNKLTDRTLLRIEVILYMDILTLDMLGNFPAHSITFNEISINLTTPTGLKKIFM